MPCDHYKQQRSATRMKKHICTLLIASLLLIGCQWNPPDTDNTSQTDSVFLENALNITEEEKNELLLALVQDYCSLPEGHQVFLTENVANQSYGKFINKDNLTENGLYIYNEETYEYFLVDCKEPYRHTTTYAATKDYVYYVSPNEPDKVYRWSYTDKEHVLLYQSAYKNISSLEYLGMNTNGKLLLCEGNRYAIFIDVSTGARTVLLEDDCMHCCFFEYAYYSPEAAEKSFILSWERTDSEWGTWIKDLVTGNTRQVRFDPS